MSITTVSLYVTDACNLRCRYCFLEKEPRRLPVEVGRQVVDFMLAAPPRVQRVSIFFFGGEPLLEFDTIRALTLYGRDQASRREKELRLGITTNGTLMTDEMLDFIFKHNISINLSLDGAAETQNRNRKTVNGDGSFAMIDPVIDSIIARNPNQGARMTYDSQSVHTLYQDHEYLWSRGFTNTSPIAALEDDWSDEALATAKRQFKLIAEAVRDRMRVGDFRRVGFLSKYINRIHHNTRRLRIPCGVCGGYIGVSVDGTVYPCQRFAAAGECAFGTIWGLTDHAMRARFMTFTSAQLEGCDDCPARMECAGGCPAINSLCAGSLSTPWPTQCAFIRMERDVALWLYNELKNERNPLLEKLLQSSRYGPRQRAKGHRPRRPATTSRVEAAT